MKKVMSRLSRMKLLTRSLTHRVNAWSIYNWIIKIILSILFFFFISIQLYLIPTYNQIIFYNRKHISYRNSALCECYSSFKSIAYLCDSMAYNIDNIRRCIQSMWQDELYIFRNTRRTFSASVSAILLFF